MKKIKINFCKYNPEDTCSYSYFVLNILRRYYDIEISKTPDYIFFNESDYEHVLYKNCIKIFYTGENIHPNFNLCDYAFGFDYINFQDRYSRLPIYRVSNFYRDKELEEAKDVDLFAQKNFTIQDLQNKTGFCSFVYSNYLADESRKKMFDLLSTYKKVNSGGKYLNNIGKPTDNKLAFESKHKFSIAFENSSNDGYTTEKIVNAFAANTIPIYWGNPLVGLEFNTKRFINCNEYESFDEVIEFVKKIDSDDELYLKILNEPIITNNSLEETEIQFKRFLKNIFDQPIEKAKRVRINPAKEVEVLENESIIFNYIHKKNLKRGILTKIYKPFKTVKFIDNLKQKFFIYRNRK